MWKYIQLMALVAVTGIVSSCVSGVKGVRDLGEINKSPQDTRNYAAIRLENGMQVVLVSDPGLQNAVAALNVKVGSAAEPDAFPGLAHYLEHMLFQGTEKFPEPNGLMKFVQTNGGVINANTSFYNTNYFFQINAEKFDQALDQFSDYFKSPLFDPVSSDKERNAVHSEWSMQQSNDQFILYRLAGLTASPDTPLQKFFLGNLDTLKDSRDKGLHQAMLDFYHQYYSANLMSLVIVGNKPIEELKSLAVNHFTSIKNHKAKKPVFSKPGLTERETGKIISYKPQQDMKLLIVDYPIANQTNNWQEKSFEAVRLALASAEKGSMIDSLHSQQLITGATVAVQQDLYMADGILRIEFGLTDLGLQARDKIIATTFAYIELLKSKGLSEAYFKEQQEIANKNFTYGAKPDPLSLAIILNIFQYYEYPVDHLLDGSFLMGDYSLKNIHKFVSQLQPERARIWFVDQQQTVDRPIPYFTGQYSIRDFSQSELHNWLDLSKSINLQLPGSNELSINQGVPLVDFKYAKPKQILHQAGIEAFLVHSQYFQKEGNGAIHLQINSDLLKGSPKNRLMAELLNDLFLLDIASLRSKAQAASITVDSFITSGDSQQFKVAGYSEKLDSLMQTMLERFVKLKISPQAFSQVVSEERKDSENNQKKTAVELAFAQLHRFTTVDSLMTNEWLDVLDSISRDDLSNFHQALLKQNLIRVFVSGNYSDEQVKQMSERYASRLSSQLNPDKRHVWQYKTPVSGELLQSRIDSIQADNALLWTWFGDKKSDEDQANMVVLSAIMHPEFYRQLRTEEQLGYLVEARGVPIDDVAGIFMLVQSSNTELTYIYQRMQKFRNEFLVKLEKLDEKAIETTRDSLVANVLQQPVNFYQESDQYWPEYISAKYTFDGRDRYLESLRKVNKSSLLKLYKSYLLNEKAGQVLIQVRGNQFSDKPFVNPQ